jgi:UDP-glucose 4-epimerase
LERGSRGNLADATRTGRVELIVGDVHDAEVVDRLVAQADIVCHQAALRITQCATEPVRAMQVMIDGTQNVLESAVRHRVRRVVAASSASVYGEPSYVPMDEAHPFNNTTLYGCAKIANEQMLRAYADMHALRYVALRPFNVYGPRMDVAGVYTEVMIRWLDRLAQRLPPIIFGDGKQTMDFVHVEDVARAYVPAMASHVTDQVFNVGSGTETSLLELSQLLCEAMGEPDLRPAFAPERKVNPVTRRRASVERARSGLGFEAQIELRQGSCRSDRVAHRTRAGCVSVAVERRLGRRLACRRRFRLRVPAYGEAEAEAAAAVVRSAWLTQANASRSSKRRSRHTLVRGARWPRPTARRPCISR